jgi:hypothetical protein
MMTASSRRNMTSAWLRRTCLVQLLLAASLEGDAQPPVAINFNSAGLASITFNGSELLGSGVLKVNRITFQDGPGGTSAADVGGAVSVNAAASEITNSYSWGTASARYEVKGSRLDLTLTVTNRGNRTIQGVFLEPLELRLPAKPTEYDNVTPIMIYNVGEPGVLTLTTATTTVALGYEDPGKPIVAGFPWANDRPTSTRFPLRINTDREPGYPDSYPTIVRPIAPGKSDRYRLSLRFGGAGATVNTLASDVYRTFAEAFPATLSWTDRRPIGQLVLATSVAGYPTNPRGWLLDSTIDTTTPAGLAAFRTKVLAWADQSVAILKELNAQGMITWDIEGEQFPHPVTYLCDPRVLSRAAPEMEPIADEYFRKFTSAGLRVGVCVRPQTLTLSGQNASQDPSSDPGQVLIDKIAYAKSRWGATIFYIDSNGDPNLPLDASVMERVAAAHPDVLLVPEHEDTRYYASTAPYRELRQNQVSTPDSARAVYPSAFGVTYVADGDFNRYFNSLVTAVKGGDVLMTRAWFGDPANAEVQRIYALAPRPPSPPTGLRIIRGLFATVTADRRTPATGDGPRAAR